MAYGGVDSSPYITKAGIDQITSARRLLTFGLLTITASSICFNSPTRGESQLSGFIQITLKQPLLRQEMFHISSLHPDKIVLVQLS